ncbi:MAG TPA: DNA polymerase III subunit alpha [Methylibium sp.]|uniref:DNA polymerase III subunit alpha n=1 Tax=Methylibium sp. TaxID=2067992 RepID=UPI002DB8DA62|nr:DNA polymerase III subunit alpha [Methylibium sp.]HEU4457639.1 DNA polymerase III subunit alpha [Methylibium sp.]
MSAAPRFVHLRSHTEYSVVDGMLRIDAMVEAAAADGQPALAITDLSNLFGAVKFYEAARSAGVQPLIGADVWLEDAGEVQAGAEARPPSRLLLLVQDRRGYLNLCELLSHAWTHNVRKHLACVAWERLAQHHEGLIALSGAELGAVGQALLAGDAAKAEATARRLASIFPGRFYLELQRAGLARQETHVRAAVPLAAKLGLPVVATHPLQFLEADDYEAHEARVCVAEGSTLGDPRRVKRFGREQHFQTQQQMATRFADLPSALANSVAIAKRCHLVLELGKPQLPDFPIPQVNGERMAPEAWFRHVSFEGLEQRLVQLYPDAALRERRRAEYVERLEFEIATIVKMGFPGYFLIVADFINWAKANGCPVGPGRGSGAGSLVAYALGITGLDPLAYQLFFERFLNPERVSMPDFDIDFCQANRERVIDYVKQRYGRDAVGQIATFGTMAAKAALRDVGRVLGMGYGHVDSIAKLVPAPPGRTVTLRRPPPGHDPKKDSTVYARLESPEIGEREKKEEEVAALLALAERVEGTVRNVGMHAGGVLIAPGKITDFCPLYQQPGSSSAVSQYDKDDVEAIGLVKFDFLGLATLTILELAREFLRTRYADKQHFDFDALPLDDRRVYALFSEGLTESVFQFESSGMRAMLKQAKPSRIEDLIALNAMFRPGPMENIPSFCQRKHGKEAIDYPHPLLEKVLGETYGIFVYQEQVMQAAQILAGYSLGGADLLRRAMGKKKPEEMAKQRSIFREGCAKNGIGQAKADEVFDLMEQFAGYGFNKSHAAAYSVLAYQTAWLKVHHPAEFYAANMTVELDDADKLRVLVRDAKHFGVAFDAPDINAGTWRFEPIEAKRVRGHEGARHGVRWGLGAIKGTGQGAIEAIVQARGDQAFTSLFDFCVRVDRTRVNKRVVEALIKAGAFDALHGHRAGSPQADDTSAGRSAAGASERSSMLASVGLAFEFADTRAAHADQGGLFDFDDSHAASTQEPALVAAVPWGVRERLMQEKQALGFYMSGHLFDEVEAEVRRFAKRRIADLVDAREPQLVAGIVTELRIVNGQRGRVALFRLDDGSDAIDAVVNEEQLLVHRELLAEDALIVVQARLQPDRFSGGLRLNVQQVWDMAAARCKFGRFLRVPVNGAAPPVDELLQAFPPRAVESEQGRTPLGLAVRLALRRERVEAELDLGDAARFFPSDEALSRWRAGSHGQAMVVYE